ncbi:MAG: hypothetical protein AVDCRST_MAG19-2237 [uncultured Thermomicrobiales bacterium]|uniref:Uncharacterized protein n=1 Tax=uncultured Thermomicrobiales bacterium TaxID=1645740 RepID=A0A6J4V2Y8_9BACT|nr:MAG: hypothetical protein AVDCRST_MAG19-2237 [uncultured Thermomicrobiales bacterium]
MGNIEFLPDPRQALPGAGRLHRKEERLIPGRLPPAASASTPSAREPTAPSIHQLDDD